MQTRESDVATPDGTMSVYEIIPDGEGRRPAMLAALGKRYQIEHYEARHGWAVIDTPVYDATEAERHWEAILALFAEELGT